MKKKTNIIIALAVSIGLLSCSTKKQNKQDSISNTPIQVQTKVIEWQNEPIQLNYSGTIEASQTIPLTFQTTGIVETIHVNEGDAISKGQLLAEVEKGSLTSTYAGALSQYERAVDAQNRLRMVYENGSLPEIKWVEINNQVTQAESILEIAKRNLQLCELHAPTSGIIGERNIEPGMSAIQIEAPFKLVKLESVLIKISVPENEISLLRIGQTANIKVSALNNANFTGIIERVGVVAHKISRTYEVKIKVLNPELMLKPGMVCEVNIQLPETQKVIQIPISAVDRDANNKPFVYLVDKVSNRAIIRPVSIKGFAGENLVVVYGLNPGDRIIVDGIQKLTNQSLITF